MSKNKVEVIIGGNIYSLQGDESQEHIQKVAAIINRQIHSIQQANVRTSLNTSKIYMLAALNVANESIKMQDELTVYMKELEKCNEENLALKDKIREMSLEFTKINNQLADLKMKNKSS